jgi:hypothetical protein
VIWPPCGARQTVYSERYGKPAGSLQELLRSGLIEKLPVDPFGVGFAIDAHGLPILSEWCREMSAAIVIEGLVQDLSTVVEDATF